LPARRRSTAVAVALVAVLPACGSDDDGRIASTPTPATTSLATGTPTASATPSATPSPTPTPPAAADVVINVTVTAGKVTTDKSRVKIKRGQSVALTITSDRADELHVHGYDITEKLTAGKPTTVTFEANLNGVWEVELHDAHKVLVRLEVAS
jgi:hypothetical protein